MNQLSNPGNWPFFLKDQLSERRLCCPYCSTTATPRNVSASVTDNTAYRTFALTCASCGQDSVFVHSIPPGSNPIHEPSWIWVRRVHPEAGRSPRNFISVSPDYVADYVEACATLQVSAKSSAAMSRRCLQAVLRDQGYSAKDLAVQIKALLEETDANKMLPRYLRDSVDAIRNLGNFAAHRINDKTTLQILDVEVGEAEWCLELIEQLFEHYFERPVAEQAKRDALNAKLIAAGKPQAKTSIR